MQKVLVVLLVIILLSGCTTHNGGAETVLTTVGGSSEPEFSVNISELMLPEIALTADRFDVLDAWGTRILCSVNQKKLLEDGMASYYVTEQLMIYDTILGETVCAWIPETPGYYFSGAFTDADTAVVIGETDYTSTSPRQHIVCSFGQEQIPVYHLSGEAQYLQKLDDGTVMFSFADEQGRNGVCMVENKVCREVLVMGTDEGRIPYGGQLSCWGTDFCYVMVQNNLLTLTIADRNGVKQQHTLTYLKEKLDDCEMTQWGVVAGLSVNEGTTDAYRSLVLFAEEGRSLALKRVADSPLYRMAFGESAGIAVDGGWKLYAMGLSQDHIACVSLHSLSDFLDEVDGTNVTIFSTNEGKLVLYFGQAQKLYLLDIAYE